MTDGVAHADRGADRDRPGPRPWPTRSAEVDGVDRGRRPDRARRRGGRPDRRACCSPRTETVNSQSVQVVRDVTAVADDTDGVIGVTGARQRAGRLPARGLRQLPADAADHRAAHVHPAGARVPVVAAAAEGGDPQPASRWPPSTALMVLFWQEGYGSEAVFGIAATGAVTFWVPMMVFAFLFGLSMDYEVFILSRDPRGVRRGRHHRRGGHRGHRPHRPAGHQRGADPVPGLRRAGLRPGHRPQGDGHRARLRHPARRDDRALAAGAVAGVAVRLVELVAPRLASRGSSASSRRTRTPSAGWPPTTEVPG